MRKDAPIFCDDEVRDVVIVTVQEAVLRAVGHFFPELTREARRGEPGSRDTLTALNDAVLRAVSDGLFAAELRGGAE